MATSKRKSDSYSNCLNRFRTRILPAGAALILTHDYPDPDCLGSAFGLHNLLAHWDVPSSIAYGGFIGRLENQTLVRQTGMDCVPRRRIGTADYDRIIVVDGFPGNGNMSMPPDCTPDAILDHHPRVKGGVVPKGCFVDIRPDLGATSTLVVHYLLAAGCPVTSQLATALFYGIMTDTKSDLDEASEDDMVAFRRMFELTDYHMLAEIQDPPRPVAYFRLIRAALDDAVRYGGVGYSHLASISAPDDVAEMADFAIRLSDLDWMVCSGILGEVLYFSLRSKKGRKAGTLAERIARRLHGRGGGHARRGAGQIPVDGREQSDLRSAFSETFRRVLRIRNREAESIL